MVKSIVGLTDFEKDLIKQEIDLIDKTITRIDHIHLTLKNWSVIIWGGSLYLIAEHLDQSEKLILLTAIIPFMFGLFDLIWVKQLLIVGYRQGTISDFVNSKAGSEDFILLDPLAKYARSLPGFLKATGNWKVIMYKGQIFFYVVMIVISFALGISL